MGLGRQQHEAVGTMDRPRLLSQFDRIMDYMGDGEWHTQFDIAEATGAPQGSVGSQLRNARVDGHNIEKRRQTDEGGTWEYRLVKPETGIARQTEFF